MRRIAIAFLGTALLAACSSGGGTALSSVGGGGGPAPGGTSRTVEQSLADFGVSQQKSPRVDAMGQELPPDWAPLGKNATINRKDELFLLGGLDEGYAETYEWRDFGQKDPDQFRPLENYDGRPWAQSYLLHATAAGDFDGDGREELFVATVDRDSGEIYANLEDDSVANYAPLAHTLVFQDARPRGLAAVSADFDGDGLAEVALAQVYDDRLEIAFLKYSNGAFSQFGRTITVQRQHPNEFAYVTLAAGQLDEDRGAELAYELNEYFDRYAPIGYDIYYQDGVAAYGVFDDATTGFAELASGTVSADVGGTTLTAKSSGIAMADVDADGLDEVILGGLTRFGRPDGSTNTTMGYLLCGLDDAEHGLAPLPAHFEPYRGTGSTTNEWIEYVPLKAADLDGNKVPEIMLADSIYDLDGTPAAWNRVAQLPLDQVLFGDGQVHLAQSTVNAASGPITANDRENFLTYYGRAIRVWGMVDGQITLEDSKPASFVDAMQPLDLDDGSLVLSYIEGSYKLVFSQPVVLAVLSAAPCGPGQNPGDCRTDFGIAQSNGTESAQSFQMTAGVVAGVAVDPNLPGVTLNAQATHSISQTVEHSTSRAYEVTETVQWQTGPAEDSVIFTSIPYDTYRYKIVQTGGNPDLVGREIQVSIPRRPTQLLTSLDYYDAHVPSPEDRIPASVLSHTSGDPTSYYTQQQAAQLVAANHGIATQQRDVGEGAGSITVTLEVGTAYTEGQSITAGWQGDVQTTLGGVLVGFSVGESSTDSISVTTGTQLIYAGRVGHLDAAHVSTNAYSFGLFAYPYQDSRTNRAYQVLNYWVTPLR